MLDPATGEIVLASSGMRLGPRLTRREFLGSRVGQLAKPGTINLPWSNYSIGLAPDEVAPFPADVTVQFKDDALLWISIMDISPEFGEGWSDWSREKEAARQAAHDRWLQSSGVPAGDYAFAKVWSDYSDKDALSMIVIRYDQAVPEAARRAGVRS